MNELAAADVVRAEVDLLAALEPIILSTVSILLGIVVFGVCRLCASHPR
jgi:exosome complex RNA-binding protein Csl4